MNESNMRCPCCGTTRRYTVLSFPSLPITGIYLPNPRLAHIAEHFGVAACEGCGFLGRETVAIPADYKDKPRPTDKQLPLYTGELLTVVRNSAQITDFVVEIGSNDGTFLNLLRDNGYRNTCGIEPSTTLSEKSRQMGLRVETTYFGKHAAGHLLRECGHARLIICRHTLEHVPDPGEFVSAIRDLLSPGGYALIEVPDSSSLTEGLNFVELWDEHLHYFTINTLERLLLRSGLVVASYRSFPHLETRNLLVHATAMNTPNATELSVNRPLDNWRDFSSKFERLSKKLVAEITKLPTPVYLLGASHPQCNFVNYLGLGPAISYMIDDDPEKVGKFPPIKGGSVGIITTEDFANNASMGSIILTGFGYPAWSRRVAEIADKKNMRIFDPRTHVEE